MIGDSVREVTASPGDPLFGLIERAERAARDSGASFFASSWCTRKYTREEIDHAEAFQVWPKRMFEPAGEQVGTLYDESPACPICGAGRVRTSPLRLDLSRAGRADIAWTIARDEWVFSSHFREASDVVGASGVRWETVEHVGSRRIDTRWYTPMLTSDPVLLDGRSVLQNDVFDTDPEDAYRCPFGHVGGLNLISELYLRRDSWDGADIAQTRVRTGRTEGVLRPHSMVMISPRLFKHLRSEGVDRFQFEVAYLV